MTKSKPASEDEGVTRLQAVRRTVVYVLQKFIQFLVSQIGLACSVVAYSILGGFLFMEIEAPHEEELRQNVVQNLTNSADRIMEILDKHPEPKDLQILLQSREWNRDVMSIVEELQQNVFRLSKNGWNGRLGDEELQWTYAGSLLYSVTVITTIGYGNIAPLTIMGRLVTIIYAIVGIPLTLLCLRNIGDFLAKFFRLLYRTVSVNITYQYIRLQRKRIRRKLMQQIRIKGKRLHSWAALKYGIPTSWLKHHTSRKYHRRKVASESNTDVCVSKFPSQEQQIPRNNEKDKNGESRRLSCVETNKVSSDLGTIPRNRSYSLFEYSKTQLPADNLICSPPALQDDIPHTDLKSAKSEGPTITIEISPGPSESQFSFPDSEEDILDLKSRLKTLRDKVPISMCLLLVTAYLIVGAVLFTLWEESWNFLTGCYFCFITLTTIGLGDFVPGTSQRSWNDQGKLVLCVLYLLFGMALIAMSFHLIQEEVRYRCRKLATRIGLLEEKITKIIDDYSSKLEHK